MTSPFLPELPRFLVEEAARQALAEDLGRAGDITSCSTIAAEATAAATIVARGPLVLCGTGFAQAACRLLDPAIDFEARSADGDRLEEGAEIARIAGRARGILSAERVALNFLNHLSGVSTYTAAFVDRIAHTRARICCTRKTVPGLRAAQKYAVRMGGGHNHRFGLDDAILIKDNHVAVCGGIAKAIERARAFAGHLVAIEIEVDTFEQLREALDAGVEAVLLDNFSPGDLRRAVEATAGAARLEASGGIGFDTVAAVAETGVDYISTSKITMAAPAVDIALDIELHD